MNISSLKIVSFVLAAFLSLSFFSAEAFTSSAPNRLTSWTHVSPYFSNKLGLQMSQQEVGVDASEVVKLFGRIGCKKFVLGQAEATIASGYVFSEYTAMKPKWVCCYEERNGHSPTWTQVFEGLGTDEKLSQEAFKEKVAGLPYAYPLGAPDKYMLSFSNSDPVDDRACEQLYQALGADKEGITQNEFQEGLKKFSENGENLLFKNFMSIYE
eukprot:CAMPEP_0117746088 /NCGR_PEP_ID=MMETSP0947-20121206/7749_1 /TAXON_ID=44440 /ORGANISM="Chattonella subsalsa, Strain CCMP2191" /LENGTH=211 /DNA_ID=CAMNT_0005563367 /DNA_START=132 /DNA_END=767 /DNA_ORIENTATION=+